MRKLHLFDTIELQFYERISAKVHSIVSFKDFVDKLTKASKHSQRIAHLRELDQVQDKKKYDVAKGGLPCMMFNCHTKGGIKDEHFTRSTGLLYLDVDSVGVSEARALRGRLLQAFPSALSVWLSAGGQGIGMLLRVHGLTPENIKDVRAYLMNANPEFHFDPKCFNISRRNYLSHDPEAVFNPNALVLDLSTLVPSLPSSQGEGTKRTTHSSIGSSLPDGKGPSYPFSGKLRFNNDADFFIGREDESHILFQVKVGTVRVDGSWIKVKEGDRNPYLFRNLVRIMWLNPWLSTDQLIGLALGINTRSMEQPLERNEVLQLARRIHAGSYVPVPNVLRRVIYNPALKTSSQDRQSMTAKLVNEHRGENKAQRIYDAIEAYAGKTKLTAMLVSNLSGVPYRTVKYHWKRFKEYVRELNATHLMETRVERSPKAANIPSDREAPKENG